MDDIVIIQTSLAQKEPTKSSISYGGDLDS